MQNVPAYIIGEDYKNANYICQDCGKTHCKVIAHHIKPAKDFPELRYDVSNGICLCVECHHKLHYGS
jgi:5-methylcytosine-specific restriction endonuclease McrA